MRRDIFLNNYQDMIEHNARYEAGEVSWTRKVTEFYDLTYDEFVVARGLGKLHIFQPEHKTTFICFRHASI